MKKRMIIYLLLICSFAVLVILRREKIIENRNRKVINLMALWQKEGKPVKVIKAVRDYILREQKLTLIKDKDDLYYAYVTADVKKKIYPTQSVYIVNNGHQKCAEVEGIDEKIDMNTGLYRIFVRMGKDYGHKERVVAYIQNSSRTKIFAVPNDIIFMDSGKYFIWKVVNGKAEKCEVDISERYGSKVVIKKGVKSGDVLIARGHKSISESDKLKIIK